MPDSRAGFEEREHTADWELAVWAPDLAGLFEQAWRGMLHLSGIQLDDRAAQQTESLAMQAGDVESLLAGFLNEILYYIEQMQAAPAQVIFSALTDTALQASIHLRPISSQEKYMKAVTYHGLDVRQSDSLLRVNIIIDV